MKSHFKVLYSDGTEFVGDPFGGGWKQLNVTKQIAKLQYVLGNSCITMEGFKEYNHLKERVGLQVQGYLKVILIGRTEGNSILIIFDLLNDKIYRMEKPNGEEWGKQDLDGWHKGKLITNPTVKFKKLDHKGKNHE